MTHLGLFEGIGGFSLAARWMGWETLAWCEWNEFGQKVLKHHFPDAEGFGDITKTDFTKYANKIDILTGGFPCQPYSLAGKRKGKEDSRHLWPEMLRSIREVKPRWVIGENVYGLINWDGGLVHDEVQTDLEAEGYEVFSVVLAAASVGAPHRRDRVWFIAHRNSNGQQRFNGENEINSSKRRFNALDDVEQVCDVANTLLNGFKRGRNSGKLRNERKNGNKRPENMGSISGKKWQNFPSQSTVCGGDDGLPGGLDGITFPKWRNESIKAYGNAIVPQVAFELFKVIEQMENEL